jgi:hypothetical protein
MENSLQNLKSEAILFYTLSVVYDICIVLLSEEFKALDKYHPIDPVHFSEQQMARIGIMS